MLHAPRQISLRAVGDDAQLRLVLQGAEQLPCAGEEPVDLLHQRQRAAEADAAVFFHPLFGDADNGGSLLKGGAVAAAQHLVGLVGQAEEPQGIAVFLNAQLHAVAKGTIPVKEDDRLFHLLSPLRST